VQEEEDSFDATPDFGAVRVSEVSSANAPQTLARSNVINLIAQGGAAKSLSSAFSLRKRQSWSPGLPKGI
jgi:hypothetical protein